jgi:hypothetical protein
LVSGGDDRPGIVSMILADQPAKPSTNGYTAPAPARRNNRATTAIVQPES